MKGIGGHIANSTSGYINSVSKQKVALSSKLNSKFIPLNLTLPDPNNPRQLCINSNDINAAPDLRDYLPFNESNQQKFETALENHCAKDDNAKERVAAFLSIAELAASIESPEKLIQPIRVIMKDGKFYVEVGHRRRLAHFMLRAEQIAAIIETVQRDNTDTILFQYKENKAREDISLYEEVISLQRLRSEYQHKNEKALSTKDLCELTGMKRTRSASVLAILKVASENPDFLSLLKAEKITSLKVASQLARVEDLRLQAQLIKEFASHPTKLAFEQALQRIKTNASKPAQTSKKGILAPKSKIEVNLVSRLIGHLQKDDSFKQLLHDLDISTEQGIKKAWDRVITKLTSV